MTMGIRRVMVIGAAVVAVIAVAGCSEASQHRPASIGSVEQSSVPGRTAAGRCLPAPLTVSPTAAAPGTPVVVSSTGGCAHNALAGAHYTLVMAFAGRQPPVVDMASVTPSSDGAFSLNLEVPANATDGDAYVSVEGSPYDQCDDANSCVGYGAPFVIAPFASSDRTGDALGPGSWSGARTSRDGKQVVISLVGGSTYNAGDYCTVAYQARVTESDAEVHVRIQGTSPVATGNAGCASVGYARRVVLLLGTPLGSRTLVEDQFERRQPVFNGAELAEPTSLPPGWEFQFEGPGYPDPELSTYWSRTWGKPPPPPAGGTCTPSASPVMLTQGTPDLIERYPTNGERAVATEDVHGQPAVFLASTAVGAT